MRSRTRHGSEKKTGGASGEPAGVPSEKKGKYQVATGLVYLRDRCPDDTLDMRLPDGSGTRHVPRIWNIAEDDAATTLEAILAGSLSWGMLFWVPLMAGGDADATILRWKEIVTTPINSRSRRGDLAVVALVFAELAGRAIIWKRALEEFDMTESQVVNEFIAKAEMKTELRIQRRDLLEVLTGRFPGAVPTEVTRLIEQQDSSELLHNWFKAAIRATTFEEFMAVLKK